MTPEEFLTWNMYVGASWARCQFRRKNSNACHFGIINLETSWGVRSFSTVALRWIFHEILAGRAALGKHFPKLSMPVFPSIVLPYVKLLKVRCLTWRATKPIINFNRMLKVCRVDFHTLCFTYTVLLHPFKIIAVGITSSRIFFPTYILI